MDDPITVLFVDDEPAMLRLIRRQLIGDPYEVIMASSGQEALEIMNTRRVDLLVSDVEMPGMSGLDLLRIARQCHPYALRMLLTGMATLETALNAINQGEVIRFLPKPFGADSFRAILEGLSDRIENNRRDERIRSGVARREQFLGWIERRFPGTTVIERDEAGRMVIDLPMRLQAADLAGSAARDALFWWTCAAPEAGARDTLPPLQ